MQRRHHEARRQAGTRLEVEPDSSLSTVDSYAPDAASSAGYWRSGSRADETGPAAGAAPYCRELADPPSAMELSESQVESFFHDGCERVTLLGSIHANVLAWLFD